MDKPSEPTELRILLLEDMPTDAELVESALREAGLSFTARRVDTREAFILALEEFKPDIVLADYQLPAFDGGAALGIVRQQYPTVPVVMVTGAMGDDEAVELLKLGARDYVLKDRLARLGPAVCRALSEERGIRNRKAAEKKLAESEAKFRTVFAEARDGIVLTDVESGLVADCNAEFERQCGRPLAQIRLLHVWELRPPELQEAARRKFEEIKITGRGSVGLGFQRPDGTYMPAEIVATRVRAGDRDYVMSISRDITERLQAEEKLRESEEKFRTAIDTVLDAYIIIEGEHGTITWWNSAAEAMFGYSKQEMIGQSLHEIIVPPRFHEAAQHGLAHFATTGKGAAINKILELAALHRDGAEFPIELSLTAMQLNGKWHAIGIVRDITARKQDEARLNEQLEELRRWHEATLGREMRTLELKHEVNELLKQAGQPPRYPSAEQANAE